MGVLSVGGVQQLGQTDPKALPGQFLPDIKALEQGHDVLRTVGFQSLAEVVSMRLHGGFLTQPGGGGAVRSESHG